MPDKAKLPMTYALRRSRRKTLALHVRDQRVEVRAPLFVGSGEIERFVEQNRDWIRRRLAEQARQADERLRITDGGAIFYKARECRLVFVESAAPDVMPCGRELRIHGRDLDSQRAATILRDWLMREARDCLPARTWALVEHLGLQERFREVVFRKTRSKWGHCTAEGRIQYNWLIMLAPDAVIDYMISHEVCHLIHMDHSAHFWRQVAALCPDYRQYRQWLKRHAHRLWF